jgi:hypothetical protein
MLFSHGQDFIFVVKVFLSNLIIHFYNAEEIVSSQYEAKQGEQEDT